MSALKLARNPTGGGVTRKEGVIFFWDFRELKGEQ